MTRQLIALIALVFSTMTAQAASQLYYIHTDHLGAPQVLTDSDQKVVWEGRRMPFGELHSQQGTITQPLRFPGQYADQETDFHYNYYRDYDPTTGRYIQSDSIGLQGGFNTYAYVGGNPISYVDPFGLFEVYATKLSKGKYVYKFDFSPVRVKGMFDQYQPYSPSKKVNRLKKLCELTGNNCDFTGPAGLSDVEGFSNKWACLEHEDDLIDAFGELGYRGGKFGGTQLSEVQARDAIKRMNDVLPSEISNIYGMDTIVDRAKSRAAEAFGAR